MINNENEVIFTNRIDFEDLTILEVDVTGKLESDAKTYLKKLTKEIASATKEKFLLVPRGVTK